MSNGGWTPKQMEMLHMGLWRVELTDIYALYMFILLVIIIAIHTSSTITLTNSRLTNWRDWVRTLVEYINPTDIWLPLFFTNKILARAQGGTMRSDGAVVRGADSIVYAADVHSYHYNCRCCYHHYCHHQCHHSSPITSWNSDGFESPSRHKRVRR